MPKSQEERLAVLEEKAITAFKFIEDSNWWFKEHEKEDERRNNEVISKIDELKEYMLDRYVTKEYLNLEYGLVKKIVYGMAWIMLTMLLTAVIWLVVVK